MAHKVVQLLYDAIPILSYVIPFLVIPLLIIIYGIANVVDLCFFLSIASVVLYVLRRSIKNGSMTPEVLEAHIVFIIIMIILLTIVWLVSLFREAYSAWKAGACIRILHGSCNLDHSTYPDASDFAIPWQDAAPPMMTAEKPDTATDIGTTDTTPALDVEESPTLRIQDYYARVDESNLHADGFYEDPAAMRARMERQRSAGYEYMMASMAQKEAERKASEEAESVRFRRSRQAIPSGPIIPGPMFDDIMDALAEGPMRTTTVTGTNLDQRASAARPLPAETSSGAGRIDPLGWRGRRWSEKTWCGCCGQRHGGKVYKRLTNAKEVRKGAEKCV